MKGTSHLRTCGCFRRGKLLSIPHSAQSSGRSHSKDGGKCLQFQYLGDGNRRTSGLKISLGYIVRVYFNICPPPYHPHARTQIVPRLDFRIFSHFGNFVTPARTKPQYLRTQTPGRLGDPNQLTTQRIMPGPRAAHIPRPQPTPTT